METKIFGRLSAWQNWIFQRPNAVGARGALTMYGRPERASVRLCAAPEPSRASSNASRLAPQLLLDTRHAGRCSRCHLVVNDTRIPNNVDLSSDKKLQRALEEWQPSFIKWWGTMGPEGFQQDDVFLRTAISVDQAGWAHFDYVKMPEYRWGIFLADAVPDRTIGFGDELGKPVWQQVPGEHRNVLRR
jgi:hypothetical protein